MRIRLHFMCLGLAAAAVWLAAAWTDIRARADMVGAAGGDPWDGCAQCHGLDGAGNHIKFPRLAGQNRAYIAEQLADFRAGRRRDDQMLKTATELSEAEIPRVADWFADQAPPWPKPTMEAPDGLTRARTLALKGADGMPACLSCHSAAGLGLMDLALPASRVAGQRDFYIARQLVAFRDGGRDNDPNAIMRKIARRLSDTDIAGLAVFLSQNPALHDEVVP